MGLCVVILMNDSRLAAKRKFLSCMCVRSILNELNKRVVVSILFGESSSSFVSFDVLWFVCVYPFLSYKTQILTHLSIITCPLAKNDEAVAWHSTMNLLNMDSKRMTDMLRVQLSCDTVFHIDKVLAHMSHTHLYIRIGQSFRNQDGDYNLFKIHNRLNYL